MSLNDKKTVRAEMLNKRTEISDKDIKSGFIIRNITQCEEYKICKRLFTYVSLPDEPSTKELIEFALADGKEVFVPKCENSTGLMTFRAINSFSELKKGYFSVPEPDFSAPECKASNSDDLCIVPGTAFDIKGSRIGYGRGYYDRFLSDFKGFTIGLCFYECFISEIPSDENDVPVNAVCTEDKLYYM